MSSRSPGRRRSIPPTLSRSSPLYALPTIEERVEISTENWARDLRSVYEHAKDRFGDVCWDSEAGNEEDRIWGHKAIVYARAPKAFKDRYFSSNPYARSPSAISHRSLSPLPSPHLPSTSSASPHPFPPSSRVVSTPVTRPSSNRRPLIPGRSSSLSTATAVSANTFRPSHATSETVLHLTHGDMPSLFAAQLEWLYTGEGFGDVVEWISAEEGDTAGLGGTSVRDSLGRRGDQAERRDKLGQDLTYMWRSKLYADVRIHLDSYEPPDTGSESSSSSANSIEAAMVTAHRFVLVSRSPYFSALLVNDGSFKQTNTADIYLPSPPFTAASLHFALGWMYAGHLDFSNRSFDLSTAFEIHRAAAYLQLDDLQREVEARIAHDFCHGVEWAVCHCRECAKRIARVWKFAKAADVRAKDLQRLAKAYLVRGWTETWGREVGLMEEAERREILDDVVRQVNAQSLVVTYKSLGTVRSRIESGLRVKGHSAAGWADPLGDMLDEIETQARHILVTAFDEVASGPDLTALFAGQGFSTDILEKLLSELVIALRDTTRALEAPRIYQTIVSAILLRVDPDTLQPALGPRSRERQLVETAKEGVLAHIRTRWMGIRDEGGFVGVEKWAMKEISDEIDVSLEDLHPPLSSASSSKAVTRLSGRALSSRSSTTSTQRGLTRTTSRMTTLSRAALTPPRAAGARPSSLVQTPTASNSDPPHSPPSADGLRRLRLTSNTSLSSNASARSARSSQTVNRLVPAAAPHGADPVGRGSPQSRVIPLGAARQRTVSTATTPASASASITARRAERGPAARRPAEPKTPLAGSRGNFLIKGSGSRTPVPSPSVPTQPSKPTTLATKASTSNAAPNKSISVAPKTPTRLTASTAASRARTMSVSTAASATSTATVGTKKPAAPKSPVTAQPISVKRGPIKAESSGRSKTPASARTEMDAPAKSTARTRTTSTATVSSARSKASIRAPPAPASRPAQTNLPIPPVPSLQTPSPSPSKPKPSSANYGSVLSLVSRRPAPAGKSYLDPAVRRPGSPSHLAISSRLTARSVSSSTDETEAVTPLLSQSLVFDPPVRRESSDTASFPPSPPKQPRPSLQFPTRAPPSTQNTTRTIRKVSSVSIRSASSFRHPALAFDPPKRIEVQPVPLPEQQITDGSTLFGGPCIRFNVGIPCIVLLSLARWPGQGQGVKRARFKANVKYIGLLAGKKGPWVGVEVEEPEDANLSRFCLERGSKEGHHYFHLTPNEGSEEEEQERQEQKAARQRRVEVIREGLGRTSKPGLGFGLGLGLGLESGDAFLSSTSGEGIGMGRERRPTSPLPGMAGQHGSSHIFERPMAMFVRPSEVVLVLGAE